MNWLLDTDACIAVLRGDPGAVAFLQSRSPDLFSVSTVTLYELLAGARKSAHPDRERIKIARLLDTIHLEPFDAAAADESSRVRSELESCGNPIGPYDILIAGHALALGHSLFTGNLREFRRIERLQCTSWRSPSQGK